jgi:hypothetical protein
VAPPSRPIRRITPHRSQPQFPIPGTHAASPTSALPQTQPRHFLMSTAGAYTSPLSALVTAGFRRPIIPNGVVNLLSANRITRQQGARQPPLQAHCHLGLGTVYRLIGRGNKAQSALSTVMALYHPMEITFWLPQVEAALAQMDT